MVQLSSIMLSMLTQAIIIIELQCIKIKLHFPDYRFELKATSLVTLTVFSTNCNNFANFWYNRIGLESNDTYLVTQIVDNCVQVINPLSSLMSSRLQCDVYEHFVYYNCNDSIYINGSKATIRQQNVDQSSLTINIIQNRQCLIHHLLVYNTSKYCDSYCWFSKLSDFDTFLNKTNHYNEYSEILILSEIVFYIERFDGCSYCQWWIDATSFMDKQCGAVIQVTISPTHWGNENQTALLTYSSNINAQPMHDTVKYSHMFSK